MKKWILALITALTPGYAAAITLGEDKADAEHLVSIRSSHMAEFPICSGSLISEQWVLTAAHCVVFPGEDATDESRYFVALPGELSVTSGIAHLRNELAEDTSDFYTVSHVVVHPDYRRLSHVALTEEGLELINTELTHDIALLRLENPIPGAVTVNVATPQVMLAIEQALNEEWNGRPDNVSPENTEISGWGSTDVYDPYGDLVELQLQTTSQAFYPMTHCYERMEAGREVEGILSSPLDGLKICTLPTKVETFEHPETGEDEGQVFGNSACIGDSGGAVLAKDSQDTSYQIGIISGAPLIMPSCGSVTIPTFHTKVATFYDWIMSYVNVDRAPAQYVFAPAFIENALQESQDPELQDGDVTTPGDKAISDVCQQTSSKFNDCSDSSSGSLNLLWAVVLSLLLVQRRLTK